MSLCNRVYVHITSVAGQWLSCSEFSFSKYEERQKKKRKSKKPNPENITERNL